MCLGGRVGPIIASVESVHAKHQTVALPSYREHLSWHDVGQCLSTQVLCHVTLSSAYEWPVVLRCLPSGGLDGRPVKCGIAGTRVMFELRATDVPVELIKAGRRCGKRGERIQPNFLPPPNVRLFYEPNPASTSSSVARVVAYHCA